MSTRQHEVDKASPLPDLPGAAVPEFLERSHLQFLEHTQEMKVCIPYEAAPYLRARFTELSRNVAQDFVDYWLKWRNYQRK